MHQDFEYEPSWEHTYDSFRARQQTRFRRAAFERANTFEGSVIERTQIELDRPETLPLPAPQPELIRPAAVEPAVLDYVEGCQDCYDEAKGG